MAIESDFKTGQFGKIGEHMVGFELSKRGWIIFYPPYDERTDIVAMKLRCKKCKSTWFNEHRIMCFNSKCSEYLKSIKDINKKPQYKNKICQKCKNIEKRNKNNAKKTKCNKCGGKLEEIALCPKCSNKIDIQIKNCSNSKCNSKEYELIFRSIQVKSSHIVDNGRGIGFNFKYQDLIDDRRHFFIVYNRQIINGIERHFYWVMTKKDFKKVKNIDTTAFQIYQNDRGHFNLKSLKKYLFNEGLFYHLQEAKEKAFKKEDMKLFKTLDKKQKKVDIFRKLD